MVARPPSVDILVRNITGASTTMYQRTRLLPSQLALAVRISAGVLFLMLSLASRAHDPFILSLASAIDQSSLTPRERLGLRLFFDSNLSEPRGTACASCHD